MNKKLFNKSSAIVLGLLAFAATGGGLIVAATINEDNFYKTEILLIFGCLFAISLADHFRKVTTEDDDFQINERRLYVIACTLMGVTLTWFINHEMGYGPVVANGLVGVMATIFLPNNLAGITYTSSFIGMSSLYVIPSMKAAVIASLIVGLILLTTKKIYAGIGGKGGTTAALSTIITKTIIRLFT